VQGQTLEIETQMGGIPKMLAEPEKWDWKRVNESILPDLKELNARISTYTQDIEAHTASLLAGGDDA
jgi:hypothetical protein